MIAGAEGAVLPLAGRRIMVTRPSARAGELVGGLEALGAEVLPLSTIRTVPPHDVAPLERACREIESFDWVVFTSASGVERLSETLTRVRGDSSALERVATCAVGPATARAMSALGIRVDLVPDRFVAEGVFEALGAATDLRGKRVLLPRSAQGRDALPRLLEAAGATVSDIVAYRTETDDSTSDRIREVLRQGGVDLVVFTSGSGVKGFLEIAGTAARRIPAAVIGPVTAAVARESGLDVSVEADTHTAEGLVAAIRSHFA